MTVKNVALMLAAGLTILAPVGAAWAEINNPQHLNNRGQQKVNNVKAKRWVQQGGNKDGYTQQNENTIVNFGSRKAGTCNMNVGSTQAGDKAPKDVVVTAQNIINICK